MKTRKLTLVLGGGILIALLAPFQAESKPESQKHMTLDIGVNKEAKEVGLKRMELIDKMLSPELIERKRKIVHSIEQDYGKKVLELIESLTTSIAHNKVIANLDVNFFSPKFDTQVHAAQNLSITILLARDAFSIWAASNTSEQAAQDRLKQIVHQTFKIPEGNITLIVMPK